MMTLKHLILEDMEGSSSDMLEPAAMWLGGCSQSPALQIPVQPLFGVSIDSPAERA